MSAVKIFKKGEALYKEGEKASNVYLIQSGSVSLTMVRQKNHVDLCILGSSQIAGEHALSGVAVHPHSAVAMAETKAIEIPVDAVRAQLESGSQIAKLVSKSLCDKMKIVMKELQSARLDRDPSPCPAEQTSKIFGTVYHVAKTKGETNEAGAIVVNWPLMRQYAQRVFLESPKRLEMAVNVFVKLGYAKFQMVKNELEPDGPDEIGFVHFLDLPMIEQFFEYYQYYYFKGGKTELLKSDDRAITMAQALADIAKSEPLDRHGSVRLNYTQVVEKVKAAIGIQLNADHFGMLENKGLFVKRQSTDDGVFLHFDYREFERTVKIWKVLREVERWNEKGFVDPTEPVDPKKAQASGPACTSCGHPYQGAPKFCAECGAKIVAAA